MNIGWLKRHLVVIAFAAVFLGLLGVIVWFEHNASTAKQHTEDELSDQQAQLQQLQSLNPYPSKQNGDALRHDREQLQTLFKSLQHDLGHDSITISNLQNEVDFSQRLREILQQLSDAATNEHVATPDQFAFGFSRYVSTFPCRNPPARPEDCRQVLALLAKQLLVVQKLTLMIISNGVEAITAIRRTEVEPGSTSTDALSLPILHDPKSLYDSLPFEIQFTCNAKSLQAFLNSLSQSDWFFAVKSLKITSESATTSAATAAPVHASPGAPGAEPIKPSERNRLIVTARIDLVEFPTLKEDGKKRKSP
jgi:hypothetical protein